MKKEMISAKEIEQNFTMIFENDRLWWKCNHCNAKFPSDIEPIKLHLEILKHKFIVEKKKA